MDVDAHSAALFTTLEADAKGVSSYAQSTALADLARLHSCAGSLVSAWLTARFGAAKLTAAEFGISTGEDVFAGQEGNAACECGRSTTAGGTHSGAPWNNEGARGHAIT